VDAEGTLWDQAHHETAIRVLVEEAKVNLCLRIIYEFKRWMFESSEKQAAIDNLKQAYEFQDQHIAQKLSQFEEYMGLLLCRALVHVETLQLMDIPLLIEHIAYVLRMSGAGGAENPGWRVGLLAAEISRCTPRCPPAPRCQQSEAKKKGQKSEDVRHFPHARQL